MHFPHGERRHRDRTCVWRPSAGGSPASLPLGSGRALVGNHCASSLLLPHLHPHPPTQPESQRSLIQRRTAQNRRLASARGCHPSRPGTVHLHHCSVRPPARPPYQPAVPDLPRPSCRCCRRRCCRRRLRLVFAFGLPLRSAPSRSISTRSGQPTSIGSAPSALSQRRRKRPSKATHAFDTPRRVTTQTHPQPSSHPFSFSPIIAFLSSHSPRCENHAHSPTRASSHASRNASHANSRSPAHTLLQRPPGASHFFAQRDSHQYHHNHRHQHPRGAKGSVSRRACDCTKTVASLAGHGRGGPVALDARPKFCPATTCYRHRRGLTHGKYQRHTRPSG